MDLDRSALGIAYRERPYGRWDTIRRRGLRRVDTGWPDALAGNDEVPDDTPRGQLLVEVSGGHTYHFAADRLDGYGRSGLLTGEFATPLRLLLDLKDVHVDEGGRIHLSIITAGSVPGTYQWFKDGSPIPNADSWSLDIQGARVEDSGRYQVSVSSLHGTLESRSALVLVGNSHPFVVSPPSVRRVGHGGRIVLTASVRGQAPFEYQWFKDGVSIPGAMAASLEITNATDGDGGRYTLEVRNSLGYHLGEPIDLQVTDEVGPSWNLRYPEARLIGLNRFTDMGDEVWALGMGRVQVWDETDGWKPEVSGTRLTCWKEPLAPVGGSWRVGKGRFSNRRMGIRGRR